MLGMEKRVEQLRECDKGENCMCVVEQAGKRKDMIEGHERARLGKIPEQGLGRLSRQLDGEFAKKNGSWACGCVIV